MKTFFEVKTIENVLALVKLFKKANKEIINIEHSLNRVLSENIYSDIDIPDFNRSTMDGYAIKASSSFGSSESCPTYLSLKGKVDMGTIANFSIYDGEAAKISTGGALPDGSDSVVMIEHSNFIGDNAIEIYKSLAPGSNVIYKGEDVKKNNISVPVGRKIRPQEIGCIAASGRNKIEVFKKPRVAIISTGNEIIPSNQKPKIGQVRDINSYTLLGQILKTGGLIKLYGIVKDNFNSIKNVVEDSIKESDIIIISGGSSLGTKDLTLEVIESIKGTEVLVHGISISPGKPTILAKCGDKQIWGLPGHAASAMVVYKIIVEVFLEKVSGISQSYRLTPTITALLNRNISSSQGRVDYVRVKLSKKNGITFAEPIIGKSGLISTMVKADGLIKIGVNNEGLYKNTPVSVILF